MNNMMLIVNNTESCEKCDCCAHTLGKYICPPRDTYVRKGERDCSCPLKPVPDIMEVENVEDEIQRAKAIGWNECLKEILGEKAYEEQIRTQQKNV